MRELDGTEKTNEELATALGVASGKLYFHTKKLLDAGLIELARTREKGPVTEKLYRRSVREFRIPIVEDGSAPPLANLIANGLSVYENTWRQSKTKKFSQYGFNAIYYVTEEQEARYYKIIAELHQDILANKLEQVVDGARMISISGLVHRVGEPIAKNDENHSEDEGGETES